jgi:hypothetical protein
MIDLVCWSFLAVLLPIVLLVCARILSLVYWSFRAALLSIVSHVGSAFSEGCFEKEKSENRTLKMQNAAGRYVLTAKVTEWVDW